MKNHALLLKEFIAVSHLSGEQKMLWFSVVPMMADGQILEIHNVLEGDREGLTFLTGILSQKQEALAVNEPNKWRAIFKREIEFLNSIPLADLN